jgi:hypothetical protein
MTSTSPPFHTMQITALSNLEVKKEETEKVRQQTLLMELQNEQARQDTIRVEAESKKDLLQFEADLKVRVAREIYNYELRKRW